MKEGNHREFKIKRFFWLLLLAHFTFAQGQDWKTGPGAPGINQESWRSGHYASNRAIDLTLFLLKSPDQVYAQFSELKAPIDFLSRHFPREELFKDLSRAIVLELNRPFETAVFVNTPEDLSRINWNWQELTVRAAETFLNNFENLLGQEKIQDTLRQMERRPSEIVQREIRYLKELLREQGFRISDRETLKRILNHFRMQYKPSDFLAYTHQRRYGNKEASNVRDWSEKVFKDFWRAFGEQDTKRASLSVKDPHLILYEFRDFVEKGWTEKLSKAERKAITLLHQILERKTIGIREVRDFRRILELLRVPPEFHHNEFIRDYLFRIQIDQVQEHYKKGNATLTDRSARAALSKIKAQFEGWHYDLLKDQAKFKSFITKALLPQSLAYYIAIGSVIYAEYLLVDPLLYQSHKNPIPVESFISGLTFPAALSLGVFMYFSQVTQFHAYGMGMKKYDTGVKTGNSSIKRNGNLLKLFSSPLGMAAGYFVSQVLYDIWMDEELHECALSMVKQESKDNQFTTSCEASRIKWSKKFNEYGPDFVTMFVAAFGSHYVMKYSTLLVRSTAFGDGLLTRAAFGLGRFAPAVSTVLSIMAFVVSTLCSG